jgi:hypothetical protein
VTGELTPEQVKSLAGITPTLGEMAMAPLPPSDEQVVSMQILKSRNMKMFSNRTHRFHNRKPQTKGEDKFDQRCARKWAKAVEHGGKVMELVRTFPDRFHKQFGDPSAMGA